MAQTKLSEHHEDFHAEPPESERRQEARPATRVLLEGDDAVENVAALLRAKPGEKEASPPDGLVAFAEAVATAKTDLPATLERLTRSFAEDERRELLDEMLEREQQNPGAFLAGALAGFAIGRSGVGLAERTGAAFASDGDSVFPGPDADEAGEADVVSRPIGTAQTGAGGPGYLEPAVPDEEKG